MKTACKIGSAMCALLSSAVVFSIVMRPGVDANAAERGGSCEPRQSRDASRFNDAELPDPREQVGAKAPNNDVALRDASAALGNAINQLELDAECLSALCGPAWRAFTHPFMPNMQDASAENLVRIEREAMAGNEDALDAFLTLAADMPDYAQHSQALLQYSGARGSVLALTTLAERSLTGYGLAASSTTAAAFYEYLAWSTGNWTNRDLALGFTPSSTAVDRAACIDGMAAAIQIAMRREIFQRRIPFAPSCGSEDVATQLVAGEKS